VSIRLDADGLGARPAHSGRGGTDFAPRTANTAMRTAPVLAVLAALGVIAFAVAESAVLATPRAETPRVDVVQAAPEPETTTPDEDSSTTDFDDDMRTPTPGEASKPPASATVDAALATETARPITSPSTFAMAFAALGCLAWLRWRRRRSVLAAAAL
jgi:uncharacterized protein (TIGR03382 family)